MHGLQNVPIMQCISDTHKHTHTNSYWHGDWDSNSLGKEQKVDMVNHLKGATGMQEKARIQTTYRHR